VEEGGPEEDRRVYQDCEELSRRTTASDAAIDVCLHPAQHALTRFLSLPSPLILFIVQAFVIVALSRLLAFFLGKIRQPRVIAEVIAGILIGPSVFGQSLMGSLDLAAKHGNGYNQTSSRPPPFRSHPALHSAHFPLAVDPLSQPCRQHRTGPLPLPCWP
jgi:hypothetical protein